MTCGTAWVWLAFAVSLCACSVAVQPAARRASPGDATIYVIERGWHSDIGLPAGEITGPLAGLEQRFPGVCFLTFGFGERQFLLARRETLGGMLSALLPSRSALLLTVLLRVSRDGLARIEAAIWRELDTSPDGAPVPLAGGPCSGSVFYAARGTYDALDTCNTWTAEMLRAGGLPVPGSGVLFVGQVMRMARAIAAQQASARRG
ncbi:MAG TPA: DUF2459 domain-containing protein [Acetobacteraceae bacterium]|nr:DUF2459 domain-containing protein [Acetobacteraceae bacterium]